MGVHMGQSHRIHIHIQIALFPSTIRAPQPSTFSKCCSYSPCSMLDDTILPHLIKGSLVSPVPNNHIPFPNCRTCMDTSFSASLHAVTAQARCRRRTNLQRCPEQRRRLFTRSPRPCAVSVVLGGLHARTYKQFSPIRPAAVRRLTAHELR